MKIKYIFDNEDIKILNDSYLEEYINICANCKQHNDIICNCYRSDLRNLKYEINKSNLKPILKTIKKLYSIQKRINILENEAIDVIDSLDEENKILINSILERMFKSNISKTITE